MYDQKIATYFEKFITDNRKLIIDRVLQNRTRYISVVLENIYQSQNASAVVRTCDCIGIQDVHVIEENNSFHLNCDVLRGSENWIDIKKYKTSVDAIDNLKKDGYRIVATSPHKQSNTPELFDLEKGKTAIVFGTEKSGVSDIVANKADDFICIPMVGFTESFNISVSAAIVLYTLMCRLRQSELLWKLNEDEMSEIKAKWLRYSIKKSNLIEERFKIENNLSIY